MITDKRTALEAALATVNYQIKNLKPYFSREQIRCWYIKRNSLSAQLKALPTAEQLKADACRHTAFVKSIIHRK